jgi:hypothetical protein
VLAVGQCGIDLRQLLLAALLVFFQLLQVLLASATSCSACWLLRAVRPALGRGGPGRLGGEGLAQARGVIAVLGLALGQAWRAVSSACSSSLVRMQFALLALLFGNRRGQRRQLCARSCWRWNW